MKSVFKRDVINVLPVLFTIAGYSVNNCEAMQKISYNEAQKLAVTNLYNKFLKEHKQVEKFAIQNCKYIADEKITKELDTYFSQLESLKETLLNLKNTVVDQKSTINDCIDYYSQILQDMKDYLSKTIASEKIILDTIQGIYDDKNQDKTIKLNAQEYEMKKVCDKLMQINGSLLNDNGLTKEEKIINDNRMQREIQYQKLKILKMCVEDKINDFAENVTKYKL